MEWALEPEIIYGFFRILDFVPRSVGFSVAHDVMVSPFVELSPRDEHGSHVACRVSHASYAVGTCFLFHRFHVPWKSPCHVRRAAGTTLRLWSHVCVDDSAASAAPQAAQVVGRGEGCFGRALRQGSTCSGAAA